MPTDIQSVEFQSDGLDDLSDDLLQQRIAAAIRAPLKDAHSNIHYGISIGGDNLLLQQDTYCELIDYCDVAKLPNTPRHFLGLCNVRGNLIPLYQLTCSSEAYRYIFIIGQKEQATALALHTLPLRCDLNKAQALSLEPAALSIIDRCSSACYRINGKLWHSLEPQQLFHILANNNSPYLDDSSEPL